MPAEGEQLRLHPISRQKNVGVLLAGKTAMELALAAGVKVGFGSDHMGALETEQLAGLRLHIEAAVVLETLRSTTSVNAELVQDPSRARHGIGFGKPPVHPQASIAAMA